MECPRIMLSAPKSGSGKTLLTCALLEAFVRQGKRLSAFKCGPDYIDPMFHRQVFGIPSKNLDSFFAEEDFLRERFLESAKKSDLAVLEGAMGLYDGLGGILEKGSAYEIACITRTPIVLVVDARGMARSIIPLLKGFLEYDREHLIKAVILNKTSGMFYQTLKCQIEQELDIQVAGYFPVREELQFESRHLGLVLPQEKKEIKEQLAAAAEQVQKSISLETLLQIAKGAEPLQAENEKKKIILQKKNQKCLLFHEKKVRPRIAVARDEAFCFYYEDNLWMLEQMGAELVSFSPIHDKELPKDCQGILLGGGYPELYLRQLSENETMRKSIRSAIDKGMPSLAECGGFMYLHEHIVSREGEAFSMVGVIQGNCTYQGKLVRFGYLELEGQKAGCLLEKKETIRGHEFHYFDSSMNGTDSHATKPVTGREWVCCQSGKGKLWGFPHLYYPSNPNLVERFLKEAGAYEAGNAGT